MIKYRCEQGDIEVDIHGTITELTADITTLMYIVSERVETKEGKQALYDLLTLGLIGIFEPDTIDTLSKPKVTYASKKMIKDVWERDPEMLLELAQMIKEVVADEG